MMRKSSKSTYLAQRLDNLGIDIQMNRFKMLLEGQPQKRQYFSADRSENIEIYFRDLDGSSQVYLSSGKKEKELKIKRLNPKNIPEGSNMKYEVPKGAGIRFFHSPLIIDAYQQGTKIDTLCITEGAFKAFKGCMHGMHVLGSFGIHTLHNAKGEKTLHDDIKAIVNKCHVKRVVFLVDSDLFDLSKDINTLEKSAANRPYSFYNAIVKFKELILEHDVDAYFAYIKPTDEKLGLDDLLIKQKGLEQNIIRDFDRCIKSPDGKSAFFQSYKLSSTSDKRIKELFGLENIDSFFAKYQDSLSDKFRYTNCLYEVKDGKPERVDLLEKPSIFVQDGAYYKWGKDKKVRLSNCTLKCLYQLYSPTGDAARILEITNVQGIKKTCLISVKDMINVTEFKVRIESLGNYIWKGNNNDLTDLREGLIRNVPQATQIDILGFHPETQAYIWNNFAITLEGTQLQYDRFGVVKINKQYYYIPSASCMNKHLAESFRNQLKFKHYPTSVLFQDWAQLVIKVLGINGHLGISFYLSSLFRDLIFQQLNYFPILMPYGIRGSGKSTFLRIFLGMFGDLQDLINLGSSSTAKGRDRRLGQFQNSLVAFDEYKNSIGTKNIEQLKSIYDGSGYDRAAKTNDNRTLHTSVLSACIIAGQEMPIGEDALFSRIILLDFFNTQFSQEQKQDYQALIKLYNQGLSGLTSDLLQYRKEISEQFEIVFHELSDKIYNQIKEDLIPDRLVGNFVSILIIPILLIRNKKITYPLTESEIINDAVFRIEKQSKSLHSNSETQKFWSIIESLYSYEDFHIDKFIRVEELEDWVAIRFNLIYAKYAEFAIRKLGQIALDKESLRNYLKHSKAYVETKTIKVDTKGNAFSCMVFSFSRLGINFNQQDLHSYSLSTDSPPQPIQPTQLHLENLNGSNQGSFYDKD